MSATVTPRVFTGASAATMSGAVTGIDLISADNATNSLANRQAHPVVALTNSYEKWMRFRCDVAPTTQCTSFKLWGPGTAATGLTINVGTTPTGVTPTAAASSVATTDLSTLTSSGVSLSIPGTLVNVADLTDFVVIQAVAAANISPGAIPQQTINWQQTEN